MALADPVREACHGLDCVLPFPSKLKFVLGDFPPVY